MRKLEIKWDKTKLVSHLGELGKALREEREKKKKKKKKKKKRKRKKAKKGMDCYVLYGLLWVCMDFWTFV